MRGEGLMKVRAQMCDVCITSRPDDSDDHRDFENDQKLMLSSSYLVACLVYTSP